jgi:hypothetical protein
MLRLLLCLVVSISLWGASVEDLRIASRLKSKMARSKLKTDGLQYRVEDGMVEWSGTVKIPQRKGAATRMAKSSGAKRVVNLIVVKAGATSIDVKPVARQATVQFPKR